jgi:NAD(P)H-flavin reductase
MQRAQAEVVEIHLTGSGDTAVRLISPPTLTPAPGQFVMALNPPDLATCRTALFPCAIHADGLSTLMAPDRWRPGDSLDLLGPSGHGFNAPTSGRWLIASNLSQMLSLGPLIDLGLKRSAEIAYWGPNNPDLNPAVEVILDLGEGLKWADYAACETNLDMLAALKSAWSRLEPQPAIEILIMADLPCGFGACQACATPLKRGYKLACVDGPVFGADELGPGW